MPERWVHSFLGVTSLGFEFSNIHKEKDEFSKKLGLKHREREHDLYQWMRILINEGCPFPIVLENAIDLVKEICHNFRDRLREKKGYDERKAEWLANFLSQYLFHDIQDFVWDEKSWVERRIMEAAVQRIYLNPKEYSNLFPPWSWDTYFSSRKYEKQREYVVSRDYEDVPEKPLKEFLSGYKSMKF